MLAIKKLHLTDAKLTCWSSRARFQVLNDGLFVSVEPQLRYFGFLVHTVHGLDDFMLDSLRMNGYNHEPKQSRSQGAC